MFNADKFRSIYDINLSTKEDVYLDLFLSAAQIYLENKGLAFFNSETTERTIDLPSFSQSQSIFTLPYFIQKENVTKIKIDDNIYELSDFIVLRVSKVKPYPFMALESKYKGHNLSITGIWGFSDKIPADIEFAFIEIFGQMLKNFLSQISSIRTGGVEITKSKIGDVDTTFSYSKIDSSNFSGAFNSPVLQKVLSLYLC